jgi:hypothetical protein
MDTSQRAFASAFVSSHSASQRAVEMRSAGLPATAPLESRRLWRHPAGRQKLLVARQITMAPPRGGTKGHARPPRVGMRVAFPVLLPALLLLLPRQARADGIAPQKTLTEEDLVQTTKVIFTATLLERDVQEPRDRDRLAWRPSGAQGVVWLLDRSGARRAQRCRSWLGDPGGT